MLVVYCTLQIISLYSFCQNSFYVKWTYACHLGAICAELCAVSLVCVLWSKTLVSHNNAFKRVVPFLLTVDGALIGYVILVCFEMETSSDEFLTWCNNSSAFETYLLVEPLVVVINVACLIYLGLRIRARLIRDPSWEKLPSRQKEMVLFRLIGTMLVCSVCFFLRSGLQLYAYIDNETIVSEDSLWISSTWLPSLLPVCILSYTMVSECINI